MSGRRPVRSLAPALGLTALLAAGPPAAARAMDWARHAEVDTVTVVTTTEDGEPRETTVWLAVVDGQGFLRTGGTRWGGDVERDPQIVLEIGEERLPLRVEFVEDDALREKVTATFRDKYGWTDAAIGLFRGSRPKIMRLHPREAEGAE
jgi:hypothetical protein